MVNIASIPPAGWSGFESSLGQKFLSSPDRSGGFWGTPSPLLRGNGVLSQIELTGA
jgi:hypothetical protein